MLSAGPRLTIEFMVFADQDVLELSGEVDMLTAPELELAVASICAGESRTVILDLRQVTFMDASGLRSLFAAKTLCCERGHELRIIPSRRVQRLFEVTGTEPDLPLMSAVRRGWI
jgi:anti-anti-sigma factor